MGQQSPSHNFAQILGFTSASQNLFNVLSRGGWVRVVALCMLFQLGAFAHGISASPPLSVVASGGAAGANLWSVSVEVSGLSSSTAIVIDRLHEELDEFDGFESERSVAANRLSFTLIGLSSTLPADAEVAIITIWDPAGGGQQRWVVRTDGSGTVITLDGL